MAGNLGHIAATVSLDIDPFQASARTLSSMVKSTTAQLKAQDAAFKGSAKSINSMKTVYSTLSTQAKNYDAELKKQAATYNELSQKIKETGDADGKLATRQANAAAAYNKTAAQAQQVANRMSALRKEIILQDSAWTKASAGAAKFAKTTGKVSTSLTSFGSKATMAITAPLALGFTKAAKSAIDFNSQIDNIGPLLTNGGAVTAKFRGQLDQMAASSKKWAVQYGVSTASINSGMEEMVKRGYTAKQTMGAMPAVLDAAKASGDDFNDVMHVSTSVLEQFGLKSNTTAGMLQNTSRVTDGLTLIANKTAAGFQDMGEAMTYVGPSAHAAGISLEETAAAIGLMSNQGIEGSVAGTALRGALTRLMKPSKQNIEGFQKLGISVGDFKKGTLTLPEILDKIKNNTKGWTDQQRASAIATAFGTEAQAGMNALVSEGGDALRGMTKDAKGAAGTTKKIAESMNNTQAAKVAKFKESLNVLAITVGQKLLPTLTPLIDKATQVITAFSKMDSSTQQSIIKWALLAAAVGPASSALGAVFRVASGGAGAFSAVAGGIGRAASAAKLGSTGFDVIKSAFSKTAFEALKVAPAAGTAATAFGETGVAASGAATGAGGLLAAISPVAPALLGAAAVATAGYAVWEIWGKKAYEAGQRTQRWGSDVGAAADKSLSSMKSASDGVTASFDSMKNGVVTSTDGIQKGFDGMYDQITKDAAEAKKDIVKNLKILPGDMQDDLQASVEARKKQIDQIVASTKQYHTEITAIDKRANSEHRALTADEAQYELNAQRQMQENDINLLNISNSKKKQILAAMNGDVSKLTQKQADQRVQDLTAQYGKEVSALNKQESALKKLRNEGAISESEYANQYANLQERKLAATNGFTNGVVAAGKKSSYTEQEIVLMLQNMGLSADQAQAKYDAASKKMQKSSSLLADTTKKASSSTKKANADWNSLIWDEKNAKVKDNLPEVLKDTANTKEGWKALNFDLKNAKINSNAKQTIVEALAASDQWQSLPAWEKSAIVTTQGRAELGDVMNKFIAWNKFTLAQQRAIVKGDYTPLIDALIKSGDWNKLTLKEQRAMVADKASQPVLAALIQTDKWQKLSLAQKQAIVEAKGAVDVANLAFQYGLFESLPNATKKAALDDTGFRDKLEATITSYAAFKALPSAEKKALLQDADFRLKLASTVTTYKAFKALPDATKKALLDDTDARQKLIDMGVIIDDYNFNHNPGKKTATADTSNAQNNFGLGTAAVDKYKNTSPGKTKVGTGDTKSTQSAMKAGDNAIDKYRGTSPGPTKVGKGDTKNTQNNFGLGTKAVNTYRGTSPGKTKVGMGNTRSTLAQMRAGVISVDQYRNRKTGPTKVGKARYSQSGYSGVMSGISKFAAHPINTIRNFISNFISNGKRRAFGDSDFEGGTAIVNDAAGTIFREMITLPNGEKFSPVERNVAITLPLHSRIETAAQSHARYGLPQFASGTNDFRVASRINSVAPVQVQSTSSAPSVTFDTTALVANQQLQIATMQQQNGLLSKMVQLLASSSGSPTGDAVRRLMQQMNTATNQIGRGRLS